MSPFKVKFLSGLIFTRYWLFFSFLQNLSSCFSYHWMSMSQGQCNVVKLLQTIQTIPPSVSMILIRLQVAGYACQLSFSPDGRQESYLFNTLFIALRSFTFKQQKTFSVFTQSGINTTGCWENLTRICININCA